MCLLRSRVSGISGRLGLIPAHVPTTFKTDLDTVLDQEKWGTWTLFISNLIFLVHVVIWHHLYYFMCGLAREVIHPLLSFTEHYFRMQHKTWRLLGGKVGLCSRWESSCCSDFPILRHSPKREQSCCRERLQRRVTAELRTDGEGISWARVTLHYTSTRFLRGLSNSLCVTDATTPSCSQLSAVM